MWGEKEVKYNWIFLILHIGIWLIVYFTCNYDQIFGIIVIEIYD